MHSVRMLLTAAVVMTLLGCQTTGDMKKLKDANQSLENQLRQANAEIASLKQQHQALTQELQTTKQVLGVMGTEKQSRVAESTALRQQTRTFLLEHVDQMRQFLLDANLNDYVGGELVARKLVDKGPVLIADFSHPMPRSGQLLGVAAQLHAACPFAVRVLRKVENEYVVIWQGPMLEAKQAGAVRMMFPVAVGVEAGDIAAYYFPDGQCVAYDKGTGNFRYLSNDLALGGSVYTTRFDGEKDRRMYSLGVFGLLK